MPQLPLIKDLFKDEIPIYKQYLPIINEIQNGKPRLNLWDIPYTIKELSYLVHSHYRYYGKFPSVLAGQILEQFKPPSPDHYVLDNFCGSGTTLVESKLRKIKSFGLDISWLSALASNVKTRHVDITATKKALNAIVTKFEIEKGGQTFQHDSFVNKWFDPITANDLTTLQNILLELEKSPVKDFILVAFIGIVRRVSMAYDGEVRPHINKDKKQRDVISAFSKKVQDMCRDHLDYMSLTDKNTESECILGNNLNLPSKFNDGKCYLVISHPPYLNSFNYTPVFSLEFHWSQKFEHDYVGENKNLHKSEMLAHPANDSITKKYFEHLKNCYEETYRIQGKDSFLAIVIGDCTRNGELIPVLNNTIDIVKGIGYRPYEFNNRTTHYGLGKYAYKHRADYHGEQEEKKDGVLIFRK